MAAYTTIDNPELYFQAKTYSGNSSTQSLTFDGSEDMQPDLVWTKKRSPAGSGHYVTDVIRGVGISIFPDDTGAEYDYGSDGMTAFDSDGFSLGSNAGMNGSGTTHIAWCWKESATAGFDIVGYTGNETNRTISHSLSAVPKMIIQKNRSTSGGYHWNVYHASNTSAPETDFLALNETSATSDSNIYWNDTAPTSSVFSLGTSGQSNKSGATNIAYLWSDVQGFSKFGSYVGNDSTDGPFIYTGFKPAFFITKKSNGAKDWNIYDNKRSDSGGGNANDQYLEANNAAAEQSGQDVDLLSNGVKIRATSSEVNGVDNNFIYMAFAEAPFVNSNGVPCNAR